MFRATQRRQDKAQLCGSLRAGREAVARGVAPLGKGAPLPARRRLALNRFPTR